MIFPLFYLLNELINQEYVYYREISYLRFGIWKSGKIKNLSVVIYSYSFLYILTITFLACYDFRAFYHTIQSTNPHACIFPIL